MNESQISLYEMLQHWWETWVPIGLAWFLAGGLVGIFSGGLLIGDGGNWNWICCSGILFSAPWLAETISILIAWLRSYGS